MVKQQSIVLRLKYLLDSGIDPERVMFTTFSVDAAESMKNKIIDVFGFMPKITIGTIDSIAAKFYFKYFRQPYRVNVGEYANYFLKYLHTEGNAISKLYHYIFFDEFQDISEIQFGIIQSFYNNRAKICIIGDDFQNIYSFRGSNIKYILNADKYFQNLSTYKITINHRSTPEIINLANASIKFNKEQIPKEMLSNKPSINLLPQVRYYDNIFMQNNSLIKKILELVDQGIVFEEIAILCRNNHPLKFLEESIERHNSKSFDSQIKYVALINDDANDTKPKIKPGHVTLTTIHKSKGLEWSVVFILDVTDQRFPSEVDGLSIQEERRLILCSSHKSQNSFIYVFLWR